MCGCEEKGKQIIHLAKGAEHDLYQGQLDSISDKGGRVSCMIEELENCGCPTSHEILYSRGTDV